MDVGVIKITVLENSIMNLTPAYPPRQYYLLSNRAYKMIKQFFEYITGAKVLRNSMPRGTLLHHDLFRLTHETIREVWDIGAHHGETSIKFRQDYPNALIRSFEPINQNYDKLLANCRKMKNHEPHKMAMSDKEEEKVFNVRKGTVLNSLAAHLNQPEEDDIDRQVVTTSTVDAFVAKNKINRIDLIKIDVEGFELEVLSGAKKSLSNRMIKFIYLESGMDDRFVPIKKLIDQLNPFNFMLYAFYEQSPHWTGKQSLWYWNALFVREDLL
jgi:FkbM family methyltransferase